MSEIRVGLGFDQHRLEAVNPGDGRIRLGGLPIPCPWRVLAHSDGDVVLHALTDAILGALAAGDIGDLFPDTAEENRNRASSDFVDEACRRMRVAGYALGNVDIIIQLETPRLGAYKSAIRERIAAILGDSPSKVSVKAKTGEGMDAVGRSEAVAAQVAVLLHSKQKQL